DTGFTEEIGEHERRNPGDEAREHPADQQGADHRGAHQWQGNASRWRPSWTNSWISEPGTSDVAPLSRPTRSNSPSRSTPANSAHGSSSRSGTGVGATPAVGAAAFCDMS